MNHPLIVHTPTSKLHVSREALPEKLWELTGGLGGKSGTKLYHSQANAQNLRRQLLRLAEMTGVGRDPVMIKAMLQKYAQEDEQKAGLAPGDLHGAATASAGEHPDKSLHLYLANRSQHLTEHPSPWLHNPDMSTHVDWDHSAYEQAHRWTPGSLEVRAVLPREIPITSRIVNNTGDNGEYHLRHNPGTPLVLKALAGNETEQSPNENFNRWFKGSHVTHWPTSSRDKTPMRPKVVYHGTNQEFDKFKPESVGTVSTTFGDYQTPRHGIFFSESPEYANTFSNRPGGRSIPVHLSIKNPLYLNDLQPEDEKRLEKHGLSNRYLHGFSDKWEHFDGEDGKHFVETLKKAGYDGAHFHENHYDGVDGKHLGTHPVWVAFHPNQVKSAIGNNGNYSKRDERLTKAHDYSKSLRRAEATTHPHPSDGQNWVVKARPRFTIPQPERLYHGTPNHDLEIQHLTPSSAGTSGVYGAGIYMTPDVDHARGYADKGTPGSGKILSAVPKFKKPLHINMEDGLNYRVAPEYRHQIENYGFDSIVPGLSVAPFDAKIGGRWHKFRDRHDLMNLSGIAKNYGHDVIHLSGIDDTTDNRESIILDPSRLHDHGEMLTKAHDYTKSLRRAEAATHPNPSPAQISAGNAPKGSFVWNGLKITIENPKGSIRRGKNPDKPWQVTMGCAYGYFNAQPMGRDGDPVDVFICDDNLDSEWVYVVNQVTQDGKFDEHKALIGCASEKSARKAYLSCYSPGWVCGKIKALHLDEFKDWLGSRRRGVLKASDPTHSLNVGSNDAFPDGEMHFRVPPQHAKISNSREDVAKAITPQLGSRHTVMFIHGGADFDKLDPKFIGTGEKYHNGRGGIMGEGHYGFVIPKTGSNIDAAIDSVRRYATRYGGKSPKIHVSTLDMNGGKVAFRGTHIPELSGFGETSHLEPYNYNIKDHDLAVEDIFGTTTATGSKRDLFEGVVRPHAYNRLTRISSHDVNAPTEEIKHSITSPDNHVEKSLVADREDSPVVKWAMDAKARHGLSQLHAYDSQDDWRLHSLIVPKENRGQGVGSKVMRELTDLADQHGKRVTLSPGQPDDHHGTTSRGRLVKFYKQFGFHENKGNKKDFAVSDGMIRDPKPKGVILQDGGGRWVHKAIELMEVPEYLS